MFQSHAIVDTGVPIGLSAINRSDVKIKWEHMLQNFEWNFFPLTLLIRASSVVPHPLIQVHSNMQVIKSPNRPSFSPQTRHKKRPSFLPLPHHDNDRHFTHVVLNTGAAIPRETRTKYNVRAWLNPCRVHAYLDISCKATLCHMHPFRSILALVHSHWNR